MKNEREPASLTQIIRKRRYAVDMKRGYRNLLIRILLILLIAWILLTKLFLLTQAQGMGMFPAVKDGDVLFAYRLDQNYQKNDLILYEVEGQLQIGRVLGVETDIVMMDDSGELLLNGTLQEGEILYPSYARGPLSYPYTVPEDTVFVLGDYRTVAKDSRDYGAISRDAIKGKVITILRRRGI